MDIKKTKSYEHFVIVLLLTLLPAAACLVLCLKDGFLFHDFYLPNSQHVKWNDEVFYYKMIGAFSEYKEPLGYFGYNESHAQFGRLGYWSPALFLFFRLFAKIFGWSLFSPLWCNMLLMTAAMFVFAKAVQPTKKQTFFVCLLYGCSIIFTRYIFSGMAEAFIYTLVLLFLSISVKMFRREKGKKDKIYWIILNLLAFWLTLIRPYWILLFLIPGYDWYKSSKKKYVIYVEAAISAVCFVIYLLLVKYFCAAFLGYGGLKTDWLKLLFSRPIHGIYGMLQNFVSSVFEFLHYVGEGIITGTVAGGVCALYLLIICWTIYQLVRKKEKRFWGYCLTYLIVMLLAVFYLYEIDNGYRHLATFVFLFLFIISLYEESGSRYLYILAMFLWIFCVRANDAAMYKVPTYTEEKASALQQGTEELEAADILDEKSTNPWDNTVIWTYGIEFTYLYALPDGVGINLCLEDYIRDNFDTLKPRYIVTDIGGEIDMLCSQEKELLAEYGSVHVWKLR